MPIKFQVSEIVKGSNAKLYWVDLPALSQSQPELSALPESGYKFLYEVGTFGIDVTTQETDYPAPGEEYLYSVPQHHYCSVSLTQTVLRTASTDLLKKMIQWMTSRGGVNFAFMGNIEWINYDPNSYLPTTPFDKMEIGGKIIIRNCIPTGTFNLLTVQPGQVLTRPLTFRANSPIQYYAKGEKV
jgi:hypothetical protein